MLRLDELDQASQDMQDMRNCHDNLLSAAAAATNSAYELSESLQDIGACFVEKAALDNDDESYKLLSMLGEVQFDLQKLFDTYRCHILMTITTPSERLLKDLRTVEDMRLQCDEKREIYEHIAAQYQDIGKSRGGKGESLYSQQLQAAKDEYIDVASLCIFRLKSLKQGQWHSLLTQATRHHAAQMNFFRKGLKSLEVIEPLLEKVTKMQHIDYQLDGLEDGGNGADAHVNKPSFDTISGIRNFMEPCKLESWPSRSSYSAPIFPEKKLNTGDKIRDFPHVPARKSHSYVLPTPDDAKSMNSARGNSSVPKSRPVNLSGSSQSLWHSSPLQLQPQTKDKDFIDLNPLGFANSASKLKESSSAVPTQQHSKRQAFSGPISNKASGTKAHVVSVSGPISNTEHPQKASSPKRSELHELPRPPGNNPVGAPKPVASSSSVYSSGPINRTHVATFSNPTRLPTPPAVQRSFSIPSINQRATAIHMAKLLESPQLSENAEEVNSPPLTPISLSNIKPLSTVPEVDFQSNELRSR
ncbi:uncharacterized protein At2g33490-like isoform X2 [Impatiens glandulifera]|nr:uncharacterized protein At2g33490-like isoform X2 [Impatiens glandulifera]XP_047310819.1 uncharacterized protein At2g33490-like isoform X2 [Impatiens glandulifera]